MNGQWGEGGGDEGGGDIVNMLWSLTHSIEAAMKRKMGFECA